MPLKVEFWWKNFSGYMPECWRVLSKNDQLEVAIVATSPDATQSTPFDRRLLTGLNVKLVQITQLQTELQQRVLQDRDILIVSGWSDPSFRRYARDAKKRGARLVLALDNPWLNTWKQRCARFALHSYLKHFSAAVVPGERSWQFARRLGFDEGLIFKGLYGVGDDIPCAARQQRPTGNLWPRSFLYVGRLSPEKGLSLLVEAYAIYRSNVESPWTLQITGDGPLRPMLAALPGIHLHGFVQPDEMARIWNTNGVLVLPSLYDPWPLVILEACRAGLPIVHSTACGSAVELVRDSFNGRAFSSGNCSGLAQALIEMHNNFERLPIMGQRSVHLSEPYIAENWAKHWLHMLESVMQVN